MSAVSTTSGSTTTYSYDGDGNRVQSSAVGRNGLFQEWAAALQFPWYFGENWDAFEECLRDLSWLNLDRLTVFATKVDQILIDEAREEFETLLTVVRDTCAGETRVSLAVVFHAESAEAAIERLGTEVQLRTI